MTKWKCTAPNGCPNKCEFETTSTVKPTVCPIDGNSTKFEENENVAGETFYFCDEVDDAEEKIKRVTQKTELPKLTAEVFDRKDCPEWAKYAAVDKNGYVFVFDLEPECTHSSWYKRTGFGNRYELCNGYDSSDYEHSLVCRPEQKQESVTDCNQLPDWCKNGALAWENGDYFELEVIDEDHQITMKYSDGTEESVIADYIGKHVKQARLRPYNAEEMKALVGKVVSTKRDCGIITGYRGVDNKVIVAWENIRYSAEALLKIDATIDGKPCGKFEHLNDAGEWVE